MTRTFIEIPLFTKRWSEIGLTDNDRIQLQIMLLKDSESEPVIKGTGGIRKVRFPLENRGKRGSVRVCYTDFAECKGPTVELLNWANKVILFWRSQKTTVYRQERITVCPSNCH